LRINVQSILRPRAHVLRRALVVLSCVVTVACSDAAGEGPSVSREVVGDTTIVRVTGTADPVEPEQELVIGELDGSDEYTFGQIDGMAVAEDGTMYVLDRQALVVRVYSSDGDHIRTFSRSGEGPGELKQPSGILFLADGRLIVRDPGNARMNVYSSTGETLTTWSIPGGFFTSAPIFTDRDGNVYTDVIATRRPDGMWRTALLRLNSDGAAVDTIYRPFQEYETPHLSAERVSGSNRSMSVNDVPFWPQAVSTLNRNGEFVGGIADRYTVANWRKDGTILRIERAAAPIPVDPGEAHTAKERITRNMRRLEDNWRWDGPEPPATKPPFKAVRVGDDDRFWIQISQPAVRQPPDEDAEPDSEGRPPLDSWVEPAVYEVFEPTGDYVATVRFPKRFRPMVLRGEFAWGVLRDEYDVEYVARLRVLPPVPSASPDPQVR
jgi:hypothetical protein